MKIKFILYNLFFLLVSGLAPLEIYAQIEGNPILLDGEECFAFKYKYFRIKSDEPGNTLDLSSAFYRGTPKIVIGRRIQYKAKSNDVVQWEWKIGVDNGNGEPLDPWQLVSVTDGNEDPPVEIFNNLFSNVGEAFISANDLPLTNDELGPARGRVWVTDGQEVGGEIVNVFFDKDGMNPHDPAIPNWFFYWEQIPNVQGLLSIPGLPLYDQETCSFEAGPIPNVNLELFYDASLPYNPNGFSTFGVNFFNVGSMDIDEVRFDGVNDPNDCFDDVVGGQQTVVLGYDDAPRINLGEGCGFSKNRMLCPIGNNGGNYHGIHSFITTLVHEREHAVITSEVWNFIDPSNPEVEAGYFNRWDMDGDGYKDLWETSSVDGMMFGFVVGGPGQNGDAYNSGYSPADYCLGIVSKGTLYEEMRCRNEERNFNENSVNNSDWSFDPTNVNQGKNWK